MQIDVGSVAKQKMLPYLQKMLLFVFFILFLKPNFIFLMAFYVLACLLL